jgi:hypothetical protein
MMNISRIQYSNIATDDVNSLEKIRSAAINKHKEKSKKIKIQNSVFPPFSRFLLDLRVPTGIDPFITPISTASTTRSTYHDTIMQAMSAVNGIHLRLPLYLIFSLLWRKV